MTINPDDISSSGITVPAANAAEIIPADTDLDEYTRAIFVGGAGNLTVIMAGGQTVTFTGVVAGTVLPIRVSQIMAATTATNIVALY